MKYLIAIITLCYTLVFSSEEPNYDWDGFASIPVLHEGRLKPLDTVARNALLILYGEQTFKDNSKTMSASQWMAELMMKAYRADTRKVFRINNPDVLGLINKTLHEGSYYSFIDIQPYTEEINRLSMQASQKSSDRHSPFEKSLLQFHQQIMLYWMISNTLQVYDTQNFKVEVDRISELSLQPDLRKDFIERYTFLKQVAYFHPIPIESTNITWISMGESLLDYLQGGTLSTYVIEWKNIIGAYSLEKTQVFNASLLQYHKSLSSLLSGSQKNKLFLEAYLNKVQPFYVSMLLYLLSFIFFLLSWLVFKRFFSGSGKLILWIGFLLHTLAILARMYIQGRPPVTSLYTSALFVGWGTVLICFIVETRWKNLLCLMAAGIIGALTQLIAHHLAQSGDTIEMIRAVLDTNFWLATHVTVISIGYASTLVAGALANIYVMMRFLKKSWKEDKTKEIATMIYGITCVSTLMSFTGTVLGGIWADQSWGRFWGWDPKENGALLIVLWCVIMLHLRWGRLVKDHTFILLAAFGLIITACSWFGVNLLGVGLHSYGFAEGTFAWLFGFILIQLIIIIVAYLAFREKHYK